MLNILTLIFIILYAANCGNIFGKESGGPDSGSQESGSPDSGSPESESPAEGNSANTDGNCCPQTKTNRELLSELYLLLNHRSDFVLTNMSKKCVKFDIKMAKKYLDDLANLIRDLPPMVEGEKEELDKFVQKYANSVSAEVDLDAEFGRIGKIKTIVGNLEDEFDHEAGLPEAPMRVFVALRYQVGKVYTNWKRANKALTATIIAQRQIGWRKSAAKFFGKLDIVTVFLSYAVHFIKQRGYNL